MTYDKLKAKTPKQLKTCLYNAGWKKEDIVDFLDDYLHWLENYFYENYTPSREELEKYSFEKLCEVYNVDIVDFIWEAICDA